MGKRNIAVFAINLSSGGAEKVISLLLKKLYLEYNVYLVLMNDNIHFNIPGGVKVIVLGKNEGSSFLKSFNFLKIIFKYAFFLKKNDIDISLSFLTRPNLINGFMKFFNSNIKVVISERCYPSIAYKSNIIRFRLYKILFPIVYNKADLLFSNSEHINYDLKRNFGVKIPMKVIFNPVELLGINTESFKVPEVIDIIYVGKLANIKNPLLLLKALKVVNISNLKVTFLGDGTLRQMLEEYVVVNNLNNVFFKGVVKNVSEFMSRASFFVLTSNSEGFPNVLVEAMAAGLPVIATNCMSGPLEILNENRSMIIPRGEFYIGKYGILINTDDSIGLSLAIKELCTNKELFLELSSKSLERADHYSLDNIYNELRTVLNDV
ncbi:glycosyltransferase [Myroides phaeus]|uniref:N-acetylgalactosamine-N,N'-diacetylbacillosaminyl-diphospho-undecaprenol 4-alpha-N-acetylgalactosaminyltransferase n=1 Tax=Myroides phaeus TaxID=702745 RepID=A0A1G8CJF2_9FLAO|nr:glycosyltransferase [Myroides phaeus]SDH45512.1 N-acetylgalactosamine-N,N'-diacetylbacillosaminyl-diphospho-undecaprenol 4-alpha-N-acetylgalactosaminyltransferase [Myroides phaeus]